MKFKHLILILIFFFFLRIPVFAAIDATVTCGNTCTVSSSLPLFSPSIIWYPGLTETRTVQVINTLGQVRNIGTGPTVVGTTTGNIDAVLDLVIFDETNGTPVWNGTLTQFYALGDQVLLHTVPANSFLDFSYTVKMNEKAGNEYQEKTTKFDLNFYFDVIETSPSPTPIQETIQSTSTDTGTGTGGGGGGGTTTLTTTTLLAPLVPVISFFQGLPDLIAIPTPGPEVAGDVTEVLGETKGASVCRDCIWWPYALLELAGLALIYRLFRKAVPKPRPWIGGLVALAAHIAFIFGNASCVQGIFVNGASIFCRFFLLIVIAIFTIVTLAAKRMNAKTNQPD